MTDLPTFIAGLPKVELHVHHVGSASPRIVAELAARHEGRTPVPADPAALADYFAFRDFAHFIEVYLSVVDLIRDPEDVWMLTYEVARELARQQVRYAELTVTPYSHVRRGIPAPAFCEAIEDARQAGRGRLRHRAALVLRHPRRGRPARPPRRRCGSRWSERPDGLISFGLGGPEIGVPRPQFKPYFDRARAAGLRSRAARGGDHRPGDRLGRAARARRRADRARHLRRAGPGAAGLPGRAADRRWRSARPPTCAPGRCRASTSTRCRRWSTAGVLVTINSDDPPMFGTTLNEEYAVAARLLDAGPRGAGRRWPGTR